MTNDHSQTTLSREELENIWLAEIYADFPDAPPTDDELNEMERIDHSIKHGFGIPFSL